MDKQQFDNFDRTLSRQIDLYLGGLLAISLILFQVFVSLGKLSTPGFISVIAFAVSMPLLTATFTAKVFYGYGHVSVIIFTVIGFPAAFVGIVSAFWYISWIAGVVFLVTSGFAFVTLSIYRGRDLVKMLR